MDNRVGLAKMLVSMVQEEIHLILWWIFLPALPDYWKGPEFTLQKTYLAQILNFWVGFPAFEFWFKCGIKWRLNLVFRLKVLVGWVSCVLPSTKKADKKHLLLCVYSWSHLTHLFPDGWTNTTKRPVKWKETTSYRGVSGCGRLWRWWNCKRPVMLCPDSPSCTHTMWDTIGTLKTMRTWED